MNFEIIRKARKSLHMTQAELLGLPVEDLLKQEDREMSIGETIHNTPGQLIKAARVKAGLTQKELGEKLGLAYQTVAQWENDLRKPKLETLKRIAGALGVGVWELAEPEAWDSIDEEPERDMVGAYETLNREGREKVAEFIELIAGNPKYWRQGADDVTVIILKHKEDHGQIYH